MFRTRAFAPVALALAMASTQVLAQEKSKPVPPITDDPSGTPRIERLVKEFLATRSPRETAPTFANVTLLERREDGSWVAYDFNPQVATYPASSVKLAFMAAALAWEKEQGHPPEWIDENHDRAMYKMIKHSDNVATGVVVDALTGTTNLDQVDSTEHPEWAAWYDKRLAAERYLESLGLLQGQTIVHKTYPTNSSGSPRGAEGVARKLRGSNMMAPRPSAELILAVVEGHISPEANEYAKSILSKPRWGGNSGVGFGLPPGTKSYNKNGWAYNNANDISYFILPNGKTGVLAIFTDTREVDAPKGWEHADVGMLAEAVLEEFGFFEGIEGRMVFDNDKAEYEGPAWIMGGEAPDKMGEDYRVAPGGSGSTAAFPINAPKAGLYEVALRWPSGPNRAKETKVIVETAEGNKELTVDQSVWGGRWWKIGDFQFPEGGGRVTLSTEGAQPGATVAVDGLKASLYPEGEQPEEEKKDRGEE